MKLLRIGIDVSEVKNKRFVINAMRERITFAFGGVRDRYMHSDRFEAAS
jgi:hypothetical protein